MNNETREQKLARIRREIEEGRYVTEERLRGACEALVGIMIDDVLRRELLDRGMVC